MKHSLLTAIALSSALSTPLIAASDTFEPPAGCEVYATAQLLECRVMHFMTCSNDPEGWQRSVTFSAFGPEDIAAINFETEWVESWNPGDSRPEVLVLPAKDPASFTELLENGGDTFDFKTDSPSDGITRFVGADALTGNTREIGGVEFDETRYEVTAYDEDGNEKWAAAGTEYIHRDWRRFLPGKGVFESDGNSAEYDRSPVTFAFPGEPGFLSVNPEYGCAASSASFAY